MASRNPRIKKLKGLRIDDDCITGLPDCLLTHILSSLPTRDAVRTTILSKRWRSLWTHVPDIDMVIGDHDPQGLVFVDRVATLHASTKIYKLHLFVKHIILNKNLAWSLDSLVRSAVANQVEDLRFLTTARYLLPREVYYCGSLRELTTNGCEFSSSGIRLQAWTSLRVLDVGDITWRDDMVACVLAACPALESLRLHRFKGIRRVDVMSPKLKELVMDRSIDTCFVGGNRELCICAPHVQELTLSGYWEWLYPSLVNVQSVVKARLDIGYVWLKSNRDRDVIWKRKLLEMVCQCEQLEVWPQALKLLSGIRQNQASPLFSNLRCLVVHNYDNIQELVDLIHCSPILERLIIHFLHTGKRLRINNMCNDLGLRLRQHGMLSNIKMVELRGVREPWFPVAEFLLDYLTLLKKMVIFLDSSIKTVSLLRLTKALLVLPRSAIVEFH